MCRYMKDICDKFHRQGHLQGLSGHAASLLISNCPIHVNLHCEMLGTCAVHRCRHPSLCANSTCHWCWWIKQYVERDRTSIPDCKSWLLILIDWSSVPVAAVLRLPYYGKSLTSLRFTATQMGELLCHLSSFLSTLWNSMGGTRCLKRWGSSPRGFRLRVLEHFEGGDCAWEPTMEDMITLSE